MIHLVGDQWRAVATVRRSVGGENVAPISKMQVHLSTSHVETQDIHARTSASTAIAFMPWGGDAFRTAIYLTHMRTHAHTHTNA